MSKLHQKLTRLYNGRSRQAVHFRYGLLAFDIATICFFIATSMVEMTPLIITLDFILAAILSVDFAVRFWIEKDRPRYMMQLMTWVDLIVIFTLMAPVLTGNFAFLRVMRALRLLRSYHVLKDLRGEFKFFAHNEDIIHSIVNLFVFIFFITAIVYVLEERINPEISTYMDALYFTVATLTTTGFGDITLHDDMGRGLSVVIMVFGVALFLRLVQTIFQPAKVRYKCPTCGLKRHDPDAIHCKHCGESLNIETKGS
ncbi:MAG: potassium channel family protein [Rhodospirillaceae bacterium]|nr:potassium channel family protein [Rhodospirillaceae bacterium]MBL6942580.1 potassium channel family protein [Rhodospirillales bacterium]